MGFDISQTVTTARPLSGVGRTTVYLASASVRTRRQLSSDRVGAGLASARRRALTLARTRRPSSTDARLSTRAHGALTVTNRPYPVRGWPNNRACMALTSARTHRPSSIDLALFGVGLTSAHRALVHTHWQPSTDRAGASFDIGAAQGIAVSSKLDVAAAAKTTSAGAAAKVSDAMEARRRSGEGGPPAEWRRSGTRQRDGSRMTGRRGGVADLGDWGDGPGERWQRSVNVFLNCVKNYHI